MRAKTMSVLWAVAVMAGLGVSCTPPPGTTVLAVAYINVDGIDGYDPEADVLIAKLVDTNDDSAVSVGDTVVTNEYPLDYAASDVGAFQTTSHTVAVVNLDTAQYANVDDASSQRFGFSAPDSLEQYIEYAGGVTKAVFTDVTNTATERVRADADAPSAPDTPVSMSRSGNPADESFIDVDILFTAPAP